MGQIRDFFRSDFSTFWLINDIPVSLHSQYYIELEAINSADDTSARVGTVFLVPGPHQSRDAVSVTSGPPTEQDATPSRSETTPVSSTYGKSKHVVHFILLFNFSTPYLHVHKVEIERITNQIQTWMFI